MAIRRIQGTQNWLSEHNKALKNGYPNKIRHSKWLSEHIKELKNGYPNILGHRKLAIRGNAIPLLVETKASIFDYPQETRALKFGYPQQSLASKFGYPFRKQWHRVLAIHQITLALKIGYPEKTVAMNKTLDYPLWLLQMNAYVSIFNHFYIRESIWSVSIQDFWTTHSSHPALQNPTKLFYIMCSFYKVRLGG